MKIGIHCKTAAGYKPENRENTVQKCRRKCDAIAKPQRGARVARLRFTGKPGPHDLQSDRSSDQPENGNSPDAAATLPSGRKDEGQGAQRGSGAAMLHGGMRISVKLFHVKQSKKRASM